ncbi:hypothetical protein KJ742_05595 [Patescibacteria group bacterium]|nr:hypothetical protein [Patescibacteria group bacterium]MBU1683391.1 hypothetical protein [Patescibacteria group bacterium]MBU1934830.1 hypothetical protein [Patescibacteria group bacterium]
MAIKRTVTRPQAEDGDNKQDQSGQAARSGQPEQSAPAADRTALKNVLATGVEVPDDRMIELIELSRGRIVKSMQNISEAGQDAVIEANGAFLGQIIRMGITPSEKRIREAVGQDGRAIKYAGDLAQDEDLQVVAVSLSSNQESGLEALRRIIAMEIIPSEKAQKAAVEQHGVEAFEAIVGVGIIPEEPVQIALVKKDIAAFETLVSSVVTPSTAVQLLAVEKNPQMFRVILEAGITPEQSVQLFAVEKDWRLVELIENPSKDVQAKALEKNLDAIPLINNFSLSPVELYELLGKNGSLIKHFRDADALNQFAAVSNDVGALRHILAMGMESDERVVLEALKQNPLLIELIDNPSPAIQLAAVKIDLKAYGYIKGKIADEVTEYVMEELEAGKKS